MKIQSTVTRAIVFSLLVAGNSSLFASSLGGNFIGRGAGTGSVLGPSESAGLFPQAFWNNIDSGDPAVSGKTLPLIDSAGSFTAVRIVYEANDSWNSDGPTATPDDKLMKGIIKANPNPDTTPTGNSDRMQFVITNLPAGGTYTIIVYLTENGALGKIDVTLGATTYYVEEQASFSGSFVPASSTTPGSYEFGVNYAGFTNVAPSVNGTITITAKKFIEDPQQNDGIGVAAIQVIQQTGPAYPVNTDTCSITNQPVSPPPIIEGGNVTVSVTTVGPCRIQWTRNNVPIPGANSATLVYTTTTAAADNGAQLRAIVYNNVITNTSNPATLEVDAATPPVLTQYFLKADRWENMNGTAVQPIKDAIILGTPLPNLTYFQATGGDVPQTAPDLNNFGIRLSGWFKPSVSGFYDFFIRSDDASALYLNSVNPGSGTNALPDVSTDSPIAEETDCCDPFVEPGVLNTDLTTSPTTAVPISLEAGKLYGFVLLFKEGGGGDFAQIAWRLTNSTTTAANLLPIPAVNCFTMASSAGQRATITTNPANVTVTENQPASFSVTVLTTPTAGQYALQWYVNGAPIPGATANNYFIASTTLAQSNDLYFAVAQTLKGPLTSSIAKLSVLVDTNPPILQTVGAMRRNDGVIQIGLAFNERLNPASVIPGNFTPSAGSVNAAAVATNTYGDYAAVALNTAGLTVGNTYNLTVNGVTDLRGNPMTTNVSFTVSGVTWAESGLPKRPGQVIPVGGTGFDILNGGRKEWEAYDEITMAYVKKTNDFDVKVRVIYAEPGSQWTRVGLQARNALNAGEASSDGTGGGTNTSAYAQTHVNPTLTIAGANRFDPSGFAPGNPTANNGHEQNQRLTAGGNTSGWGTNIADAPTYPNAWLRLARTNDTLYGFRSTNGVDWVPQGVTVLTDQQPDMFVGPFVAVETANIWTSGHNVFTSPFNPTYDRLFVYQFRDFGDFIPPPTLKIERSGANVVLTYGGVLQSATVVTGAYTDVTGASSPYTVPATGASRFFRARSN